MEALTMITAIKATSPSSMQLSIKNLTTITLAEVLNLMHLENALSGHFLEDNSRKLRHPKIRVAATKMMKIGPSSMMKFEDWYPDSSKFSFLGSYSDLNENIPSRNSSVSITSKFVSFMMEIIMRLQFYGMMTFKSTVSTIIWRVLISPHKY